MTEVNPSAPDPSGSERKIETFEDCDIGPGSRLPDNGDTVLEFGDVHYAETERGMDYCDARTVARDGRVIKEGKLLLYRIVEYIREHPDVQVDNANRRPLSDEARQAKERRAELDDLVKAYVPQDRAKNTPADIVGEAFERAAQDRATERFPDTVEDFLQRGHARDKDVAPMEASKEKPISIGDVKDEKTLARSREQTGEAVDEYKRQVQAESQQRINQINAYFDEKVARLREQREAAKVQHIHNLRAQTERAVENMRKSSLPDSAKEAAIEVFYQNLKESIEKAEKG